VADLSLYVYRLLARTSGWTSRPACKVTPRTMPTAPKVIAIDGDGVLLDYHDAYARAWERAFGETPALIDPCAYWPYERWGGERLIGRRLERLRACIDEEFWSTMRPLPGALQACKDLVAAGYGLVCVSAIEPVFHAARWRNLRLCGFPIEGLIATANLESHESPKAKALRELKPVAFVDDYAPYLQGIGSDIHAALILRDQSNSPNTGEWLQLAHSTHANLPEFAQWWLEKE
jgi:hypothetical protein